MIQTRTDILQMKIVICDDNIQDLTNLDHLITKYKTLYPNLELEVEKFSDAGKLTRRIKEHDLADIYILDMILQASTGIEIGRQIRLSGSENVIIYISSFDDYAMDAYGVHAARYLLKPVSEEKFFEAMDYAISHTGVRADALYLVKTEDGLMPVPYSDIEYIENSARRLSVCLRNGKKIRSVFIRKSFDEEIHEIAARTDFLQVHKSFLINLNYVKKLTQNNIMMESGKVISVSKTRASDVKKTYLLYVSDHYR